LTEIVDSPGFEALTARNSRKSISFGDAIVDSPGFEALTAHPEFLADFLIGPPATPQFNNFKNPLMARSLHQSHFIASLFRFPDIAGTDAPAPGR
jgi:hypothetical protein